MRSHLSKIKQLIYWPYGKFRTMTWKKKAVTIVVLLIVLIAFSAMWSNLTKEADYETAMAERSNITEIVSETGSIVSSGRTDVFSPTNGIVTEVYVANGQSVTRGETLLTVESSATEQERHQASANLLAAQNLLSAESAKMNSLQAALFEANQRFINDRGVDNPTQDQRDDPVYIQQNAAWLQAEANYKNQTAVISQAQAQVNQASLAYQATQNATVKAPISGSVANLAVTDGSTVRANTQTVVSSSPNPVLVISSPGTVEVVVSISETDIAKVKDGQKATIDVSSVHSKVYDGVVRRVDEIGTDDQGVIRYNVYIEITNPDEKLRQGMNADVDIVTEELKNVLSVPNSAVKPYQGGRAVRIIDEKTNDVKYIPVEIGVRGSSKTQILKGIEEGQEVVTVLSNERIQRPGLFGN